MAKHCPVQYNFQLQKQICINHPHQPLKWVLEFFFFLLWTELEDNNFNPSTLNTKLLVFFTEDLNRFSLVSNLPNLTSFLNWSSYNWSSCSVKFRASQKIKKNKQTKKKKVQTRRLFVRTKEKVRKTLRTLHAPRKKCAKRYFTAYCYCEVINF